MHRPDIAMDKNLLRQIRALAKQFQLSLAAFIQVIANLPKCLIWIARQNHLSQNRIKVCLNQVAFR